MPILLALSGKFGLLPLSLIILALVFWSHRENIRRLAFLEKGFLPSPAPRPSTSQDL